ncbi:Ser/Thr protein phosphatase [Tritrichomonas foetus]|uniref:Serine/threonine-protein phosphatase n=1 Tax=Tritrichomonas foetus TaxID=1144522 RepID=A0A1J4KTH9_9EUKA|nr:Ser/Thr protein phosphatase [Tritrichomonas foetus]|eukprot:OHT13068.1 Ser/Thr protein phosphatase [Tritrichomonas foetus]
MSIDPGTQASNFDEIYRIYHNLFSHDVTDYETEQTRLILPILPIPILVSVCEAATKVFMDEPNLLEINCDVAVVGDLHGHILDLFRILNLLGTPPERNYLFLGDFVDRGEFSTETITIILIMKILYPQNIFIIRGNHEFGEMFTRCGFSNELEQIYDNSSLKNNFQKCFSYMPLAALVHDSILCVHGGIGPNFNTLGQIADIKRPLHGYDDDVIMSIVWSDPTTHADNYLPSTRGSGYLFGCDALSRFLKSQVLDFLVRGHECIPGGVEEQLEGKMATVFSASNYCGMLGNECGVLILNKDKTRKTEKFPALNYLRRYQARFIESEDDFVFKLKKNIIQAPGATMSLNSLPALNRNTGLRSSDSHLTFQTLKSPSMLPNGRRVSITDKFSGSRSLGNPAAVTTPVPQIRRRSVAYGGQLTPQFSQVSINMSDPSRKLPNSKRMSLHDTSSNAADIVQSSPTFGGMPLRPVVPTLCRTNPTPRRLPASLDGPLPRHEIKMPTSEPFPSFRKRHYESLNKPSEHK